MELSPSWETANCAATQKLTNILWNPKDQCCVYKSPRPVRNLSQINSVHTTQSYLSNIHLNVIHPTYILVFLVVFSFLAYQPTAYMHSFSPSIRATCPSPSHPPWLHHSSYAWRKVQVMKLLIMQPSPTSWHFICPRSKYSPQHSLSSCSSLNG
jgi:hypothetical protein